MGAARAASAQPMSVTREEVAKIASLARIKMGDEELDRMVPELNNATISSVPSPVTSSTMMETTAGDVSIDA